MVYLIVFFGVILFFFVVSWFLDKKISEMQGEICD